MINKETAKTLGYIALAGGIIFAGYKLLQKVNLIPDKDDKDSDKLDKILSFWQSNKFLIKVGNDFFKKFNRAPKIAELSSGTLVFFTPIALGIYDSKKFFNDNEEKLYTNFRKLSSRVEFWQLNYFFEKKYFVTVLDFVMGFTSSKERAIIFNILKSLPVSSKIKF